MEIQKISKAIGYSYKKNKPIFSETEIKAFKTISGLVLALVATAGALTLAVVAPNLISAIGSLSTKKFSGKNYTKKEKQKRITQSIYYLKKSGMVKFKRTTKDIFLQLTQKGKQKLEIINFDKIRVESKNKWDSKWWLIAGDIPTEDHRSGADLFRRKLKEMGFKSLQRTLWMYPFDPKNEVEFVANHFGIGKFVTIMEVSNMDRQDESILKKHFRSIGIL